MDVSIDLRKDLTNNAGSYYEKSKKATSKIKGAEQALKNTRDKISSLEVTDEEENTVKRKSIVQAKWFEKFRWFKSSDDFLVIGGRDAVTNEILVKKHVEKNDIVFHANVQGAPFIVVKNQDAKKVPEGTLREAAEAAASYSSAWKQGAGSADVYQVNPDQVSKSAQSGEYLPKGAFMIRGEKKWYKNTLVRIAIGFLLDDEPEVVAGPVSSVESKTKYFVEITPGEMKSKELAIEVKKAVQRKTDKENGLKVKNINLDEIQKRLPGGKGRLA